MQQEEDRWEERAPMPTARCVHSICDINDLIYVIGGANKANEAGLSNNEVYDPKSNKWLEKKPMPTPRYALTTNAVNGKIYAIGGANDHIGILKTVEEYDPQSDTWLKRKDMPEAKCYHASVVINNKIYIFGGGTGNGINPSVSIFIYDPILDFWEKVDQDIPEIFHVTGSVAIYDDKTNKVYFIGGGSLFTKTINLSVYAYDLNKKRWGIEAKYITPVYVPAAAKIGRKIYKIGGQLGGNGANVEIYDIDQNKWEISKNPLPTPRGFFGTGQSCSVIKNIIYIIGGTNNFPESLSKNEALILSINIGITNEEKLPTTWGTLKQVVKKGK